MVLGDSTLERVPNTKCECTFSILHWGFLKAQVMMVIVCHSGIDQQPSITDGPGYFKKPSKNLRLSCKKQGGGEPSHFHGRLFDVFKLRESVVSIPKPGH